MDSTGQGWGCGHGSTRRCARITPASAPHDQPWVTALTGLRPSEQIALLASDCDVAQGKARVMTKDKDRTKTSDDRLIELCPRALEVLKRHLALRARLTFTTSGRSNSTIW